MWSMFIISLLREYQAVSSYEDIIYHDVQEAHTKLNQGWLLICISNGGESYFPHTHPHSTGFFQSLMTKLFQDK